MPYQAAQFEHQEIASAPRGWKIRTTTTAAGAQIRVAYPPGRRRRGSGRVISILHPNPEQIALFTETPTTKVYRAKLEKLKRQAELADETYQRALERHDDRQIQTSSAKRWTALRAYA